MILPSITSAGHVMEVKECLMFLEDGTPMFFYRLECKELDFDFSGTGPDMLKVMSLMEAFKKALLE